ncbi:MAG: hypothetical protein IPM50_13670 [Acidobacteriota bacterium]|nr:MAG: hypothetical protein IPM50_13670 [Acidobacteriota bacterium]
MSGEQHNTYVSWTFLGYALFQSFIILFIGAIFLLAVLMGAEDPDFPAPLMAVVFAFVLLIHTLMTAPSFIAWYAIRGKKSWARVAAIIAAALAAMNAPIGTAAAVYSLWFFVGEEWKKVYSRQPEMLAPPGPYSFTDSDPGFNRSENEPDHSFRHPPDWR